jgi:hypothetical protein
VVLVEVVPWCCLFVSKVPSGKPYGRGRLSTIDLLVQNSLDQLIFVLEILFNFVTKQPVLMRRSTVLGLPLQLVLPWLHPTVLDIVPKSEDGRKKKVFLAKTKRLKLTMLLMDGTAVFCYGHKLQT